jgi:hypothetical protein
MGIGWCNLLSIYNHYGHRIGQGLTVPWTAFGNGDKTVYRPAGSIEVAVPLLDAWVLHVLDIDADSAALVVLEGFGRAKGLLCGNLG